MKRLVLVLNGKGGVGKSFFAVNFVQYLKDHHIKHAAIDTDNENSTLKRFHPEANFLDLSRSLVMDPIFCELEKYSLVVVDCRAASTDIFLRCFETLHVFDAAKEFDTAITIILPINNDPDSLNQIQLLTGQFDARAKYIVVKNRFFGEQFDIYDKSKTRVRILDDLNGKEIEMPALQDWLVVALNRASMTITPAIESDKFLIFDRQRLLNWQREFYGQLESVSELLPPRKRNCRTKEASHE